ncbi:MAG TPA: hypothetical protein VGO78_28560 [Acidimicrobiales bacterium]|nr:hypothetical protein [Acidimicrobiales bacterium]
MRASDQAGGRRPWCSAGVVRVATGLALAVAATVTMLAPVTPAAAVDDGEDVQDRLVQDVYGYGLQAAGDPLAGGSGAMDRADVAAFAALDAGRFPDDLDQYANTFVRDDLGAVAVVLGLQSDDLDAPTAVAAFRARGEALGVDPLVLPGADQAGIVYSAYNLNPSGRTDGPVMSLAAFAQDDMMVVVIANVTAESHLSRENVLERFVTAQESAEPTPSAGGVPGLPTPAPAPATPAGRVEREAPAAADDGSGSGVSDVDKIFFLMLAGAVAALVLTFLFGRKRPAPTAATPVPVAAAGWSGWTPPPRRPPPPVAPPPVPWGGFRTGRRTRSAPLPAAPPLALPAAPVSAPRAPASPWPDFLVDAPPTGPVEDTGVTGWTRPR